jgi:hypothetical protein
MADDLTISKQNSPFPAYLDFQSLRAIGIRHLQALSSQIWTDYNLHDPGVTILEVLCYAITDLGYRNNLDIKDLLALNRAEPQQKETNFFTADNILTCNPVTLLDLRKRLIDIPGVRNAWIEKTEIYTPAIYVNTAESQLQYTLPSQQTEATALRLNPRGLYTVSLDLEPPLQKDACGTPYRSWSDSLDAVKAVLCAYRNLCEDIHDIVVLGEEEIALCADIELTASADPETVLVEIYVRVQAFLAPRLRFYTLQELLAMGRSPAEIFAGRPSVLHDSFDYPSHGFIDTAELEALQLPKALYTSDLYAILLDVPGVAAIKKLSLINYINGLPQSTGHPWHLILTEKHRPVLSPERSSITFFKGDLPFKANRDETLRRYQEQQAAYIKVIQDPEALDLAVPQGSYYDLADYYSIHHEFPQTYGISQEGLPETASALRKAQARQLKGYLIFFDQILANYLAQLSHIRDLFSWESETERQSQGKQRSYFTAGLTNVPKGEEILRNFYACPGSRVPDEPPIDYAASLGFISEDPDTYTKRRNQFLDHLLARFAETFSDYVLLNYQMGTGRRDEAAIIQDKAQFLSDYPALSRDRFRAFNYCDCKAIWDTENVSGFQKRVARLLGISDFRRRTLGHYRVNLENSSFTISLSYSNRENDSSENGNNDNSDDPQPILLGHHPYPTLEKAEVALSNLLTLSFNPNYYKRLAYRYFFHYGWQVMDSTESETAIVRYDQFFPTLTEQQKALPKLLDTLQERLATLPPPAPSDSSEIREISEAIAPPDHPAMNYITLTQDESGYIFFQLVIPPVGEEGEVIGFTGVQRYATVEEAKAVAIESLQKIQNESLYHPLWLRRDDAADPSAGTAELFTYYGYGLIDAEGYLLATTPERFATPQAREIALQRWITGLLSNHADFSVSPATECFVFEIRDRTGQQTQLRGRVGLPTAAEAKEDLARALVQGQSRSAYTLTDAAETYGFFLRGEGEIAFALHPPTYATARERNLRLEELLYYLNQIEPVVSIRGERGTFQAILLDREGNPLLITYHSYATQGQAEAAYQRLLHLASDSVYFQILNDLEGENPYGFSLVDRRGRTFATHPGTYPTACQRDWAIRSIINYVNTDIEMRLVNREGQVFYELIDQNTEPLLVSVAGYATDVEAITAFNQMVPLAQERDRYLLIDDAAGNLPYSFALLDGTTQLAQHPVQYATPAERDQALQAVINRVIDADPNYRIEGVEGQFTYALVDVLAIDTDAPPLLTSVVTYPDEEVARTAFTQMVAVAALPDRYTLIDTLPPPDRYGFELRDEQGERLAVHQLADGTPIGYGTAAERSAAIAKIVAYASRAEIQTEIVNVEGAFFAEIRDEAGYLIWVGQQTYPDTQAANTAAQQILLASQQGDRYELIDTGTGACAYSFALKDETGTVIATHPVYYPTLESCNTQIERWQLSMAGAAAFVQTPTLPGSDETALRFTFTLPSAYFCAFQPCDAEFPQGSLLSSPASWDSPEAARAAFVQRLSLAKNPANFEEHYDNAACQIPSQAHPFSFTLKNPADGTIALVSTSFARRVDLRAAIAFLQRLERGFTFSATTPGTCCGYYYSLKVSGLGEVVSLRSLERYATEAQAWQSATRLADQIHRLSRYITLEESPDRPWRFGITDEQGTVLAATTTVLEPLAVFQALNNVESLLRWEAVSGETSGYRFQVSDRTGILLLQGTQIFPDETAARDHFYREVLGRLWEPGTLERTETLNGYGFQVRGVPAETSYESLVIAFHPRRDPPSEPRLYPTTRERDEAIAHLLQTLRTAHLLQTAEQQTPAYTGQIVNDIGEPLLQGTRRHTYEWAVLGTPQGSEMLTTWMAEGEAWQSQITTLSDDIAHDRLTIQAVPAGENRLNRVLYRFQLVSDTTPWFVSTQRFVSQADAVERGLAAIAQLKTTVEQVGGSLANIAPDAKSSLPVKVLQRYHNGRERSLVLLNLGGQAEAERAACEHGNDLVELAQNSSNIRQIDDDQGTCTFTWELTNEGKDIVLAVPLTEYPSRDEREEAIQAIQHRLNDEGFHLVEHILLRPRHSPPEATDSSEEAVTEKPLANRFLPIAQNLQTPPGTSPCLASYDPYSFWISIILPYWPQRFQDMNFRRWVERTLRLEAPAHIALKICWIDLCQMHQFETAYRDWLEQFSLDACQQAACHLPQSLDLLIDRLTQLKNVYPKGTLHDCKESSPDDNPILLNQTALGTAD